MFIPRGVPVNRLGVSLLMVAGIAAFALLCVIPERFRGAPWTLIALGLGVAWVSTLIIFTGGPRSDFFPLYFLILILAGASAEKRWHVAVVATLVCLGYVSHLLFFNVMRDSMRDFLIVRVPVYFTAAYSTYFLVHERLRLSGEKTHLEKLTNALDKKAEQMKALFAISQKIGSKLKVKAVLDDVVNSAAQVMTVDAAAIHLHSGRNSHLTVSACRGLSKKVIESLDNVQTGEGIAGLVAMTGEPLRLSDIEADNRYSRYDLGKISSLLAVPMTIGSRTIGVLTVFCKEQRWFTDEDVSFLTALAGETAIAEETARLYEQTERLSLVDDLTNLFNVRKLKGTLKEEMSRSKRFGHPFAFIMADIDYFKEYNDRYGHKVGDIVLKKVARLMADSSRSVDSAFRYGGEEFCLVLPETNREQALEAAERMRKRVEEHNFDGEEKQPNGTLTVSMGIAVYPDDATDGDALISLADQALYSAKRDGRNLVAVVEPVILRPSP